MPYIANNHILTSESLLGAAVVASEVRHEADSAVGFIEDWLNRLQTPSNYGAAVDPGDLKVAAEEVVRLRNLLNRLKPLRAKPELSNVPLIKFLGDVLEPFHIFLQCRGVTPSTQAHCSLDRAAFQNFIARLLSWLNRLAGHSSVSGVLTADDREKSPVLHLSIVSENDFSLDGAWPGPDGDLAHFELMLLRYQATAQNLDLGLCRSNGLVTTRIDLPPTFGPSLEEIDENSDC